MVLPFEEVTDEIAPISTVRGLAVLIPPQAVQKVLQIVTNFSLGHHFQYLKRVQKSPIELSLRVLLTPASDEKTLENTLNAQASSLMDAIHNVVVSQHATGDAVDIPLVEVLLPGRAPVSPEEFTEWNKLWPFSVPKPQTRPSLTLPADEVTNHLSVMEVVWKLASQSFEDGFLAQAAAIVDPKTRKILSRASSESSRWNPRAWRAYSSTGPGGEAPLQSYESICVEHPVMKCLKMLPTVKESLDKEESDQSYLAVGLDAYVSHEPCAMCAMALVHSRIARVFYTHPNPVVGALGSLWRVHTLEQTNHRFISYRFVGRESVLAQKWVDPAVESELSPSGS